jgi:hypothetical protein
VLFLFFSFFPPFPTLFCRYLDKKKTAEEMEQHYQHSSSVDYSLKEGETLVLQIKNNVRESASSVVHEAFFFLFFPASQSLCYPIYCVQRSGGNVKSKFFEQGANNSSEEKSERKESLPCLKLPPPPPSPGSPATPQKSPTDSPTKFSLEKTTEVETSKTVKEETEHENSAENQNTQDVVDDDFGDFQAAV